MIVSVFLKLLVAVKCYLIEIFICISLITNEVSIFFVRLLVICWCSSEECLVMSFDHSFIGLSIFSLFLYFLLSFPPFLSFLSYFCLSSFLLFFPLCFFIPRWFFIYSGYLDWFYVWKCLLSICDSSLLLFMVTSEINFCEWGLPLWLSW